MKKYNLKIKCVVCGHVILSTRPNYSCSSIDYSVGDDVLMDCRNCKAKHSFTVVSFVEIEGDYLK